MSEGVSESVCVCARARVCAGARLMSTEQQLFFLATNQRHENYNPGSFFFLPQALKVRVFGTQVALVAVVRDDSRSDSSNSSTGSQTRGSPHAVSKTAPVVGTKSQEAHTQQALQEFTTTLPRLPIPGRKIPAPKMYKGSRTGQDSR